MCLREEEKEMLLQIADQILTVRGTTTATTTATTTTTSIGAARTNGRHGGGTNARTRPGGDGVVGAEHADTGTKLGATERHHVLANMSGDNLAMLGVGVRQDVLDEIVTVLIAGDVDKGNAGTFVPALADTVKIAAQKLGATNLQTLLDHLGRKLVHAVLGGISNDMVDGSAAVSRGAMLADVLDAPVAKLAMSDNVDIGKHLLNARTL